MDQALLTFLTAFVSSMFVLIGILLGNRHNSKENAKRLAFELELKEKERFHNLKKDILLNATDELIKISKALGSLVNPVKMTPEENNAFNTFLMAMNRIVMVGNSNTTKLANELIKFFTDAYLEIKKASDEVLDVDSSIEINQLFYDKYTSEIDRILNLISANYESDEISVIRNDKYQITLENQIQLRKESHLELRELYELKDKKAKEVLHKLGNFLPEIGRLSDVFSLSVRSEILGEEEGRLDLESSEDFKTQLIKRYQELIDKI